MDMTHDEKVYGIVTRHANYKDYHRMITLFSPKHGMLSVLSPGSKRTKSTLRAGSEMFIFGNFNIKVKGQRKTLSEVEIVDSFYDLRTDIVALSCAYYMRDFCEYTSYAEQDNTEIFALFVRCLTLMCHNKVDPKLVQYMFEINIMKILGMKVVLDVCIECGKKINKNLFNIQEGGTVCKDCKDKHFSTIEVSPKAINTLKLINNMPIDKLSVIRLNQDIISSINVFWEKYIRWHLDKKFKSASFIDKSRNF